MRVPGILGGLGPQTTAVFYNALAKLSDQSGADHRAGMLMVSVPIKYSYEQDAIQNGQGEERLLPMLFDSVRRLEDGGADFIAMPCNSLHIFHEELQRRARVPFLNIVEETASVVSAEGHKQVGLLGSPITLGKQLYQRDLNKRGIEAHLPGTDESVELAAIIHRLVLQAATEKDRDAFERMVMGMLDRGAGAVILACTDLQLLLSSSLKPYVIDTLEVLVTATMREILKGASAVNGDGSCLETRHP
jgi:aspartate racemase